LDAIPLAAWETALQVNLISQLGGLSKMDSRCHSPFQKFVLDKRDRRPSNSTTTQFFRSSQQHRTASAPRFWMDASP
jgi:hypothetical protein